MKISTAVWYMLSGHILLKSLGMISMFFIVVNTVDASNGALAYAYPLSGILLDGDLSDWPSDIQTYKIEQLPYGNAPKSSDDFQASFKTGHDIAKGYLYLAVSITDDSKVVDSLRLGDWGIQDMYTFYLDASHDPRGSGVNYFSFTESDQDINGVSVLGEEQLKDISWDPLVNEVTADDLLVRAKRKGHVLTYEIRVDLGGRIRIGNTIGIDHVILDQDSEDPIGQNTFVSWGANGGKSQSAERLGDVLIMSGSEAIGTISGSLRWAEDNIDGYPPTVIISSVDYPGTWTKVTVDTLGTYTCELPLGAYDISPAHGTYRSGSETYRMDLATTR